MLQCNLCDYCTPHAPVHCKGICSTKLVGKLSSAFLSYVEVSRALILFAAGCTARNCPTHNDVEHIESFNFLCLYYRCRYLSSSCSFSLFLLQGFLGLYRGLAPPLMAAIPANSCFFAGSAFARSFFNKKSEQELSYVRHLLCQMSTVALCTWPISVVILQVTSQVFFPPVPVQGLVFTWYPCLS